MEYLTPQYPGLNTEPAKLPGVIRLTVPDRQLQLREVWERIEEIAKSMRQKNPDAIVLVVPDSWRMEGATVEALEKMKKMIDDAIAKLRG